MKTALPFGFLILWMCAATLLYGQETPDHTAAPNVQVIEEAFQMPQLNRSRRIWVYLPLDYDSSTTKRYPVLYMQDGQNLFDEATGWMGNEWKVDESLNAFFDEGLESVIVVGIEHGNEHRSQEYAPWVRDTNGVIEGGEGDEYADFLTKTLKPYIDNAYRTMAEREHTGIAGSSLGGLISLYTTLKYPEVYSKVGMISPALFFNPEILEFAQEQPYTHPISFYFVTSEEEGDGMLGRINQVADALIAQGHAEERVKKVVTKTGPHNEIYFGERFPELYLWLYNPQQRPQTPPTPPTPPTGIEDVAAAAAGIFLYPNPARDQVLLKMPQAWSRTARGYFMDLQGRVLSMPHVLRDGMTISVENLPQGLFFLVVETDQQRTTVRLVKE
jgi:predicted alpha/beta superfamily hydrolase